MADGSPEVPEDLAQVANEKGIPLDLMLPALALGFPAEAVQQQIQAAGADPDPPGELGPADNLNVPP